MAFNGTLEIKDKKNYQADIIELTLAWPHHDILVSPGQFFNFVPHGENTSSPMLRRPISVSSITENELTFVIKEVGNGTKYLTSLNIGDTIDAIGPLGRGFSFNKYQHILIIGGGIGIAPLMSVLNDYFMNAEITTVLGYREYPSIEEAFLTKSHNIVIASDKLSENELSAYVSQKEYHYRGILETYHGNIVGPVEELLSKHVYDMIYCCGPEKMLSAVDQLCKKRAQQVQLLLESKMACGVGACLTCTCKQRSKGSEYKHVRVCKEGPVFYGGEIIFEES